MTESGGPVRVAIPALAGSRDRAEKLLASYTEQLAGRDVFLDCRHLKAATVGFTDELVQQLFTVHHARSLTATDVTDRKFGDYLRERAVAHGVEEYVRVAL